MNKQEAFQNLRAAIRERRATFESVNLFEDFEHFKALHDFLKPSSVRVIERAEELVQFIVSQQDHGFCDRELLAAAKAEELSFCGEKVFDKAEDEFEYVGGFKQVESLENQFLVLSHQL